MTRLASTLAAIERMFAVGAALSMAAIMVVVFIDVVMRYIFNAPLTWSYEGVGMFMMPVMFFLALSYTYRRGHHVNVDVLLHRFPMAARRLSSLLSAVVGAPVFGTMAALAGVDAWEGFERGQVLAGSIPWPTWLPLAIASAGLSLFTARMLLQAVLQVVLLRHPDSPLASHLAASSPAARVDE